MKLLQSRCSGRGESPCQFATCMNNLVAIAEIIAMCTSIMVLQHNDIVVNRPHDVVNRRQFIKWYVNKSCARYSKLCTRYSKSWEFLTPVPISMCFDTNGAPYLKP